MPPPRSLPRRLLRITGRICAALRAVLTVLEFSTATLGNCLRMVFRITFSSPVDSAQTCCLPFRAPPWLRHSLSLRPLKPSAGLADAFDTLAPENNAWVSRAGFIPPAVSAQLATIEAADLTLDDLGCSPGERGQGQGMQVLQGRRQPDHAAKSALIERAVGPPK
jgi:hypothetical protein